MRCRDPDTARGVILQVLRRSWGMAAFRENARLIVRRLGRVGDGRASATIRNSESTHRRLRRVYENAAEHYRCGNKAIGPEVTPWHLWRSAASFASTTHNTMTEGLMAEVEERIMAASRIFPTIRMSSLM